MKTAAKRFNVAQLNEIDATKCPCGTARRAFGNSDEVASVHLVNISRDAVSHYHKVMHEIYVILEGEGFIELDDEKIPVKPMTAILIKPGCRHRAVGEMKIINMPIPAFDPKDEWFD
jgi:mannose-6-phosphate isomerase-like protein (cupin superfamily)